LVPGFLTGAGGLITFVCHARSVTVIALALLISEDGDN
jgi:hypothetical protein